MSLNASELRTRVKANVHNNALLTDPDDYNIFLNLGQERIVRDSPSSLGIKRASLSLVPDDRDYDLASNFYQIVRAQIPSESRYLTPLGVGRWVEEIEWQETVPSGTPEQYCITGVNASTNLWQISFSHNPSTAMTCDYWYRWMPTGITGTATTTPVHSQLGFSELLIWAATVAAREHTDPRGMEEAEKMYQRHLATYRAFDPQQPARTPVWGASSEEPRRGGLLDPAHFSNR